MNNIKEIQEKFYFKMQLIRKFEERLFELFSSGELFGTIHTSIGQEAISVGVINNLSKKDIVISSHRCHGQYIEKTGDITGLLAEIMGKSGGVCKGYGGSQHLHTNNFFSNGVLGNMFPVAAGMGFANKLQNNNVIITIFVGDGAFGEGTIYETLNLISLLEIPILVVVENNQYAQSTPIQLNFAGTFSKRIEAFDISFGEITSNDVIELNNRFEHIVGKIREDQKPHVEVINTYRLAAHSKGDDDRPSDEIDKNKNNDPIKIIKMGMDPQDVDRVDKKVNGLIEKSVNIAREMNFLSSPI